MSQSTDITLSPGISGTAQRTELNDIVAAIVTQHSGASRPSYLTGKTGLWMKVVSGTSHELYYFDGTDDILVGTFNLSANTFAASGQLGTFGNASLSKSANFTAVAADFGKIFLCNATSASFTANLDVTATLGASWFIIVQKTDSSANAVVIDPNSTNTINGATTLSLTAQYDSAIVIKLDATSFAAIVTKFPNYASTTASGVVELATDTEAQTGTDTVRAITPANLQAVTATETRKGVVELATTAEATTGTDTVRAVTPAGLAAYAAANPPSVPTSASTGEISGESAVDKFIRPDRLKNSKAVVKAWGNVNWRDSGSIYTTLNASFNVSSASQVGGKLRITFNNAMATTTYNVHNQTVSGSTVKIGGCTLTTGYVDIPIAVSNTDNYTEFAVLE